MAVGKAEGLAKLAARLKAPRHCSTWAGSLDSYRSTVRNMSCSCKLSGGALQARRKWEIFSIWTKGMEEVLNLTPGGGRARLTSLYRRGN